MTSSSKPLLLPALRGVMGHWVYYSCLMRLSDLANRVSFASKLQKNKNLSSMIQRELNSKRSEEITKYLEENEERFFNTLVIAVYGGDPTWQEIDNVNGLDSEVKVDADFINQLGFLSLNGQENLFAIDGQHRLSGIKKLVDKSENFTNDLVSVIFVGHKRNDAGLRKTRRLFTTLNKKAKSVNKNEIIALDEDDVMAIVTRMLIEESDFFNDARIAFVGTPSMPSTNKKSFTTIVNIYDCLTELFTKSNLPLAAKKTELTYARPSDEKVKEYYFLAKEYFELLFLNFDELNNFHNTKNYAEVTEKNRGSFGGHILFRPKGMRIFTQLIAKLTEDHTLEKAVQLAATLPVHLNTPPYSGLIWQESTGRMKSGDEKLVGEVLMYMLGADVKDLSDLLDRYRKSLNDLNASLPKLSNGSK